MLRSLMGSVSHVPLYAAEKGAGAGGAEGDQPAADPKDPAGEGAEGADNTEKPEGDVSRETPEAPAGDEPSREPPLWMRKQQERLKRKAETAEAELARVRAENETLKARRAPEPEADAGTEETPPARQPARRAAPEVSDDEIDRRATEKAQQIAAQSQFVRDCNDTVSKGRELFGAKQWEQAATNIEGFGGLDPDVLREVLSTENPAAVLFELGRNGDKFEEMMELPPGKRLAAFVKLASAPAKPGKKVSDAPAPIDEVNQSNRGDGGKVDLYDPKLSGKRFANGASEPVEPSEEKDAAWFAERARQKAASKGRPWSRNNRASA